MTQNDSQPHVEMLLEKRAEVALELDHLREALKIEVSPEVDEADPDLVEREKTMSLVKSLERKLLSIDYAIRQAQRGTYGICERCGQPIPPERLEIFPETTLCVSCKQISERELRRRAA